MSALSTRHVIALGAALLFSREARAYQTEQSHWNPASLPIPYLVNAASVPPGLGVSAAVTALDGGHATWAGAACTRWRARNAGNTSSGVNANDRQNTYVWISSNWPSELGAVNVTIGVTSPIWQVGGYFFDADIQFNNVGFVWSTTGARGTVDAQSIATHEEGHFLGLGHTPVRGAIMLASYAGGLVRNLSSDDQGGVCALYPSGVPVPDAGMMMSNDPCAQYTSCAGCTPVNGCGWCNTSNSCQSGGQTASADGRCTGSAWAWVQQQCTTTTPPPDSGTTSTDRCARFTTCDACTPIDGCGWCGATGRCATGTQTGPSSGTCGGSYAWFPQDCAMTMQPVGGTAQFGEPCRDPRDCDTGGICVGIRATGMYFCTQVCTDDCTCPRGYTCGAMLMTGQRVCIPGTNACSVTPPTDAGTPIRDSGTPVRDSGTTVRDSGSQTIDIPTTLSDVGGPATDTANVVADGGSSTDDADPSTGGGGGRAPGCGCSIPQRSQSRDASSLAVALAGLFAAALTRRRRTA